MGKGIFSKLKKAKSGNIIPLAVISSSGEYYLLSKLPHTNSLNFSWSKNGIDFIPYSKKVVVKNLSNKTERIDKCFNFSLSKTPNGFIITYLKEVGIKKNKKIIVSRSKDLHLWSKKSEIDALDSEFRTVLYHKETDKFELYLDGLFMKCRSTHSISLWRDKPSLLFTSRIGQFDEGKLTVLGSLVTDEGIVLIYDASVKFKDKILIQAGAVVFDKNNSQKIIWRSGMPIWQGVISLKDLELNIYPLGVIDAGNRFLLYWRTSENELLVASIPPVFRESEESRRYPKIMERFHGNPIIEPSEALGWEKEGTFNPAVVEDDEGAIHLLYRAVGSDGISRIGYAKSLDGKSFRRRSPHPVFVPERGMGMPDKEKISGPFVYNPYIYTSGGGWGGAEDPRAVIIDGRVYMLYTAFEGWEYMRIALTSISLSDFKVGKWKWSKPKLISSPNKRSKNWLLFPEKINGKFAILHSIAPKILIDYIDDLEKFDSVIHSPRPEGPQPGRKRSWDHFLKGSGPPPVKTEIGWLLMYHALESSDTGKYRLGAMILDNNDPTKILYRSAHPILSPDMHYENDGKPGVVYASGLLIKEDRLYVYYGGGDRVVCVATTPLKKFLKYLVTGDANIYKLDKA